MCVYIYIYRTWTFRPSNCGTGERFLFSKPLQIGCEAHQASHSVGTLGCFPDVKRREREVNHSPPSIAEVKNEWGCTSASPVCLHDVDRENFTFTFLPCYTSIDEKGIQSTAGKIGEAVKGQIKCVLFLRLLGAPRCTLTVTP